MSDRSSQSTTEQLGSYRFVNLITMRHKGNILPDIVGDEAWDKFETHVRNNRACKMPSWFLGDKTIRLGPDDKGIVFVLRCEGHDLVAKFIYSVIK